MYEIHHKTNVTFNFTENVISGCDSQVATDNQYGTSIFASTVYPCHRYCSGEASSRGAYNVGNPFECIGKFIYNNEIENSSQEISTCSRQFRINQSDHLPLMVIPGKTFVLPIALEDDFQNEVPEVYHVAVHNNGNSKIAIDRAFTNPKDKGILLFGNAYDQGRLLLTKRGFRAVSLSLAVHMKQCPPGYIFSNDSLRCICSTSSNFFYKGVFKCNPDKFHAYIQHGYWIGYDNNVNESESTLLTGYCPFRFCFPEEKTSSPNPHSREVKAVPQELEGHHTGPLGLGVCTRLLYRPKGTAIPIQASNGGKPPTRGSELPLSRGNKDDGQSHQFQRNKQPSASSYNCLPCQPSSGSVKRVFSI